jgi:hypothetical protein
MSGPEPAPRGRLPLSHGHETPSRVGARQVSYFLLLLLPSFLPTYPIVRGSHATTTR